MLSLIIPPSDFLEDEKVFPNLGILRIAAYLEQQNVEFRVLDLLGKSLDESLKILDEDDSDVYGITSTSPQISIVMKIGSFLKSKNKKIIIGGPHVTMLYSSYLAGSPRVWVDDLEKTFDTIVIGDGEKAILIALKTFPKIINSEKEPGLFLTNEEYEKLPFPARHLIDLNSYHYYIDGERTTSLISQMGCPFGCNFCGGRLTKTFRQIRTRSIKSVMKEIDFIYTTYGYKGFMFYDDELNVNSTAFLSLLTHLIDYQKAHNVKFKLRGFVRSDLLTQKQADKMIEAGFEWLLVGFESGSNRILKNMNKKTTVDINTKCCEIARKSGLKIKALMSIGHSGESFESIKETEEWIEKINPDEVDFTIISVYPGTPYFDYSEWIVKEKAWRFTSNEQPEELLFSDDIDFSEESAFYKGKLGEYKSFVYTNFLTRENLVNERDRLEIKFRRR